MAEPFVFNPRDSRYKTPFGAAPCGSKVKLTLRPLPQENFTCCTLVVWKEFAVCSEETILPSLGPGLFHGTYVVPKDPELLWYSFRFTRADGSMVWLGKTGYCQQQELRSWQLTVFDDTTPCPSWFGKGVTYQIFPDRFFRSCIPDPTGIVGNRVVHQNWEDAPVYRPDEHGIVQNNDYFGGNLEGIRSKLDYLQSLGVTTIYLCPIFEAASNHRYNTADYMKIDPMLGTEEDFRCLCADAKKRGIHIILDGVFNHTGSTSRYFNADGWYPETGAAQSSESPYASWYHFRRWPDQYDCWWGINTLPAVNEHDPGYRDFIINNKDSVIRHWLLAGASGWRLDVADELPDDFIADIRQTMTEENPDSFLLGEVWEDGSNKISYSRRRKYLLGHEINGLMNYPFRNAALNWLTGGNAADFKESMETLRENYPRRDYYSSMNILSTHDTPRILTLLGVKPDAHLDSKDDRASYRLSVEERQLGLARLRLAAMLLFTFPGSPTIFYGDEAGMEGFEDPLNRGTFPWGHENHSLQNFYAQLGKLRQTRPSLQDGAIKYIRADGNLLVFRRTKGTEKTITALNAGFESAELMITWRGKTATNPLSGKSCHVSENLLHLTLPPVSGIILI